ncbi:MAG TPA: hypothetical protein VN683_11065 [Acidothermaceae bacterium]|nr:hypothetical protein [Acidothermaceae bacterium]
MAGTPITQTPGSPSTSDDLRQQYNLLVGDVEQQRLASENSALTAGGCAEATTTTKAKSVNTIVYYIEGVGLKSKGATDNLWDPTPLAVSAALVAGQSVILLLLLDAAGAGTVAQSSVAATLAACTLPRPLPSAKAVVGTISISAGAATTFTPGTTALATAGALTVTFADGFTLRNSDLLAAATINR